MARVVQSALVAQLIEWGEKVAAQWYEQYWCGDRGTYTIGDAGIGHAAHNNGVESTWPKFSLAVCGSAGKSKQLKVDVMIGNMIKYVGDVSRESAAKQIKLFGSHRFLRDPILTAPDWQEVQRLDIRILQLAQVHASEGNRKLWRRMVNTLSALEGPLHTPPGGALITQQIQIYLDQHGVVDINRLDIECIIAPTMMGLRAVEMDKRYKSFDALKAKIDHMSNIFYDLVVTPSEVATKHPGITVTDMVAALETFVLLQPVRGGTSWKCSCRAHFRNGICPDSTLFKMLWYPDCVVPDEFSVVQLQARSSSRKPGVFACVSDEPTFQERGAQPKVWNPTGMAGEAAVVEDSVRNGNDDADLVSSERGRQKRKARIVNVPDADLERRVNGFLRSSNPPPRFYSPERELPLRIAAMPEEERYFFQDWLADVRKRRAQACHPSSIHTA